MILNNITELDYSLLHVSITQFRNTFNLPISKEITWEFELATDKLANVELHNSLHLEEFKELAEATTLVEQADAIGDMIYVIVGRLVESGANTLAIAGRYFPAYVSWLNYLYSMGTDLFNMGKTPNDSRYQSGIVQAVFDAIHESNMTKACAADQVEANVKHYADRDTPVTPEQVEPNVWVLKVSEDLPTKGLKKGKVMKSIYYTPVDLCQVLNVVEA